TSLGEGVPPDLFRTRTMLSLINSAQDYGGLINDIASYQKEIQFEGELNNGVLVFQSFLDVDLAEAVNAVNNLMTARVQQFEHVLLTEVPGLLDDFNLDRGAREKVRRYIEGMKDWMAAMFNWYTKTARYQEAMLRKSPTVGRLLHGPTGLGTAAARIGQ